jgi:chromosome partitioning protein
MKSGTSCASREPERVRGKQNMDKILAVANQKGGVGKTTTSVNLAASLAATRRRVLLVDMDAQANTGASFGLIRMPDAGVWDVMTETLPLAEARQPSPYPNLTLLPATPRLRTADLVLGRMEEGVDLLRPHLRGIDHDVVLIDCPPSFGLTALNAVSAASAVVIPSRPDPFSHEGMVSTWAEITRLRRMPGMDLAQISILLTMHQAGSSQDQWIAAARAEFGHLVCDDVIPMDDEVMTAAQAFMPALVMSPDGLAGEAYRRAAHDLAARFGLWDESPDRDREDKDRDTVNTLRDWRASHRELTRMGDQTIAWTPPLEPPLDEEAAPPQVARRKIPAWIMTLAGTVAAALGTMVWMLHDALLTVK